jgi:hypothetical protein
MKNILLSSAAIALLAGAASAEVTWSGDAELGYNDDVEDGFYWDAGLFVNLSQELNNGWTASASLDIDLQDRDVRGAGNSAMDLGTVSSSDWVVEVSNDMFSVSLGDIDLAYASFAFVDGVDENTPEDNAEDALDALNSVPTRDVEGAGLAVAMNYGNYSAIASTLVYDDRASATGTEGNTYGDQLVLGADFDMFALGLAWSNDDDSESLIGSVSATFAGADILFNYGEVDDDTVYGLGVSYPVGPVVLGAYYAVDENEADDDAYGVSVDYAEGPITVAAYYEDQYGDEEYAVEGAYDFGMGLVVTAGYIDGDDATDSDLAAYIVAEYDLGGGASFLASYTDYNNGYAGADNDDIDTGIGGYELNEGATLALSLEF